MQKTQHLLLVISLLLISISSCKKDTKDNSALKAQVVQNYASIVYASYDDAVIAAQQLKQAASNFISVPNQTNFDVLKQAYISSREPYGQTDAYRFYGGPIDDNNGREGEINAWPMDEGFVDYIQGNPAAGIINDSVLYPVIDKNVIADLNEFGGETNISTGYHAIEFLIWGQDLFASSAGQRPYTDYVVGGTAQHPVRRGQFLMAAIDLLIDDLVYTRDAWAPNTNNYRKTFESQSSDVSLKLILSGLGKFCDGELYGERMLTAYDTQSQEDEHSCFSDQTQRDFVLGQKGLSNVYFGDYTRTDGTVINGAGFNDLVNATDADLNTLVEAQFNSCKTAIDNIQSPFDQEIVNSAGRTRVKTAIDNGKALSLKIVSAAKAIGLNIVL
jgi:putative iron-regulated protein